MRIAAAQTLVTTDVARNAAAIRRLMRRARQAGVDLVHFTEGALSGYGRKVLTPFERWSDVDWSRLRAESERIAALAGELGLWTVFGSVHRLEHGQRPHNCLYVVDAAGRLVARYDKRFCSHNELAGWYTPGFEPCTFEVGQVRLGLAICLDVAFPETFEAYRELGVHVLLVGIFGAGHGDPGAAERDAIWAIRARAQASHHHYWISLASPANRLQGVRSQVIDPLGNVIATAPIHRGTLVMAEIDLGPDGIWQRIGFGRAWRASAREGGIYRELASRSPRTGNRTQF